MADLQTLTAKKRAFLAAYNECGNITRAAEIAGVARQTHYDWMSDDEHYAAAFASATEHAADRLEQEARRRAVEGVDEPVFYKGEPCGTIRKYSDTLLIFLLKGVRPEKFRDRYSAEISGPDGAPVQLDLDTASLVRKARELASKADGGK